MTKINGEEKNTFVSPSITAFYTKPFKSGKRLTISPACILELQSGSFDFADAYLEAQTPWIISQTVNNVSQNLFKFHTHADGLNSNYEVKVAISAIKPAGTVAGSEYGSFTVTIRAIS